MNKLLAIFFIYLGSVCYTLASFLHLALGDSWTFSRAYVLALIFVGVEYVFNVIGNKYANFHLSVFQIMILIIAFDLVNLYILNTLLLKNKIDVVRDGISAGLVLLAVLISSDAFTAKK